MLLSNGCPFHGATEDELIEKIFEAKVVFEGPVWDAVSPEAKSLIKKLLNVCTRTRLSMRVLVVSHDALRPTLLRTCMRSAGPCSAVQRNASAEPPVGQVRLPARAA